MSKIIFNNFEYDPEKYYFLYVGELKTYGINLFLQDALKKVITDREVDFFAIVPDVFEQYDYDNIIVINPVVEDYIERCNRKKRVSCRITSQEFYTAVSYNKEIRGILEEILRNQSNLYVYMYESSLHLKFLEDDRITLLGPDPELVTKVNNKVYQYQVFSEIVPIAEYRICYSFEELLKVTKELRREWEEGIFVSLEYSAGGSHSTIAYNQKELIQHFKGMDTTYLIARYIPHEYDPTVLGVVGNKDHVYIAGVADQLIVDGHKFTGSTYPSILPKDVIEKLGNYTREIGKRLGEMGYRGIFGCDYIVDEDMNIYFVEVNARKQGTTLEFCCTLENCLPPGSPNLPELEMHAVLYNRFPEGAVEPENCTSIHWGTYNFKVPTNTITEGYIPQFRNEREVFKKVARGKLKKDFIVLEHIGNDFIITTGTFLGRVVSVANNRQDMLDGIRFGKKLIENTIFLG